MIDAFIKYFTIFICSLYIVPKLLNIKTKRNIVFYVYSGIYSTFITVIYLLLPQKLSTLYIPFAGLCLYIFVRLYYYTNLLISFSCTLISYALSYVFFTISTIIVSSIYTVLEHYQNTTYTFSMFPFISILQLLTTMLLFKIRRFKNGMPFIKNDKLNYLGFYICSVSLISICIMKSGNENTSKIYLLPFTFIIISFLFIFIWWKGRLKNTYIKSVHNRELTFLKNELAMLKKDNEFLSSLIHKDNKLIPALELAVRSFISSDNHSNEDTDKILYQLNKLSDERKGIINNCSSVALSTQSTGYLLIDALINYMIQKSYNDGITMKVKINGDINSIINNIIDENDFNTILADLCENALIATRFNNGTNILVCINADSCVTSLDIYDSGTVFDDDVLTTLGIKRITTHKDSGGSGIGLSSTYNLCMKYNASFVINDNINTFADEINNLTDDTNTSSDTSLSKLNFTKKVSVIFDGKSEYRLKTTENIHNMYKLSRRADLIVDI